MRLYWILLFSKNKYSNATFECQVCYSRFMRISFTTPQTREKIGGHNGYGYATLCILNSLTELGYEVNDNDRTADVEFVFNQPQNWEFVSPVSYKIGYHPWESTELLPGWADIMNECDEIWTPSPLIAEWYTRFAGIKVPVYVYEHGVEHDWEPVKREPEEFIKFLHVGAEASRKGGWELVRHFRDAFNGTAISDKVKLTLKMVDCRTPLPGTRDKKNEYGQLGRVTYVNQKWSPEAMRRLFRYHDVYAYPSYGEGFGLTPLQAMATGMPTILPPAWAPYKRFTDPNLSVGVNLSKSNWPDVHPGFMLEPKRDDVIDALRYAANNYSEVRDFACSNAFEIHKEYDWNHLTKEAFSALEKRLENS